MSHVRIIASYLNVIGNNMSRLCWWPDRIYIQKLEATSRNAVADKESDSYLTNIVFHTSILPPIWRIRYCLMNSLLLSIKISGLQILAVEERCLPKFLLHLCRLKNHQRNEYNDRAPTVGIPGSKAEGWSHTCICRVEAKWAFHSHSCLSGLS